MGIYKYAGKFSNYIIEWGTFYRPFESNGNV